MNSNLEGGTSEVYETISISDCYMTGNGKSNAPHLQHNSHSGTNYYSKCSFCVNPISDRCNSFLILHETLRIFDRLHDSIINGTTEAGN